MVAVISRPPRRRRRVAVDDALDFRDRVDDDRVVLDGTHAVKIPVAQQVQVSLFNFPLLRLAKRQAANQKKRNGDKKLHGAKSALGQALVFNHEWTRRNANEAEHSFSLREKVAGGRMRVKTLGCFFAKATFSPSPQPSPAGRGRLSKRTRLVSLTC